MFNLTNAAPMIIVRSIIRKVVGIYEIFSEEKEEELKENVICLFTKYEVRLKDAFSYLQTQIGKFASRFTIENVFREYEIPIEKDELDFIILELYKKSTNCMMMPFPEMFKIFPPRLEEDSS